jgi:hypothetical protein
MQKTDFLSRAVRSLIPMLLLALLAGCTAQIEHALKDENRQAYEHGAISSEQYGINQREIEEINP